MLYFKISEKYTTTQTIVFVFQNYQHILKFFTSRNFLMSLNSKICEKYTCEDTYSSVLPNSFFFLSYYLIR